MALHALPDRQLRALTASGVQRRLPLSQLVVDPRYQRDLSPHKVKLLAAAFDPAAIGSLIVSARPDGSYAILDGQHRAAALRQRLTADTPVNCLVLSGLTPQQEARLFNLYNTNRAPVKAKDQFRARLYAGEEKALMISLLVEEAGFLLDLSSHNRTDGGRIQAVGALERIYDRDGEAGVRRVLRVIARAWGKATPHSTHANILNGLTDFLRHYEGRLDEARLVERLGEIEPQVLMRKATAYAEVSGGRASLGIAYFLVSHYNHKLKINRLPEWNASA